jgi:hypothetical protein
VIEAMINIIRYRSDYTNRVLQTFEILQNNFPSTLNDYQIDNVRKKLQLKLFNLLKYSVSSDTQSEIMNLLTNLGCTQIEVDISFSSSSSLNSILNFRFSNIYLKHIQNQNENYHRMIIILKLLPKN